MHLKPTKRGIKVWVLATHQGYVCSFDVYTGKVKGAGSASTTLGERVVNRLVRPFTMKGHQVFCDRFFTSPSLAISLWEQKKTLLCGTVQLNRKGMPKKKPSLRSSGKAKDKRGTSLLVQSSDQSRMVVSEWMGKKSVIVLSSGIDTTTASVQRCTGKTGERSTFPFPLPVAAYISTWDMWSRQMP